MLQKASCFFRIEEMFLCGGCRLLCLWELLWQVYIQFQTLLLYKYTLHTRGYASASSFGTNQVEPRQCSLRSSYDRQEQPPFPKYSLVEKPPKQTPVMATLFDNDSPLYKSFLDFIAQYLALSYPCAGVVEGKRRGYVGTKKATATGGLMFSGTKIE